MSNIIDKLNTIVKPVSTINFNALNHLAVANMGLGTAITSYNPNYITQIINNNKINNNNYNELNLLDFARLYKIGQIPIIDFVIVYIILYVFNKLYSCFDYKFIFVATIPITVIFNLIVNKRIKLSNMMIFILLLSIIYLWYSIKYNKD